jgi:hypothetical protein
MKEYKDMNKYGHIQLAIDYYSTWCPKCKNHYEGDFSEPPCKNCVCLGDILKPPLNYKEEEKK